MSCYYLMFDYTSKRVIKFFKNYCYIWNKNVICRRLFLLPKKSPDGCRVEMVCYATGDTAKYDLVVFVKRLAMLEDVKFHREAYDRGRYIVIDAANFTLSHAMQLTPGLCYNLIRCLQVQYSKRKSKRE